MFPNTSSHSAASIREVAKQDSDINGPRVLRYTALPTDENGWDQTHPGDPAAVPPKTNAENATMWEEVFFSGPARKVTGRLGWIENTWFQALVGLVIAANALCIGLETDIKDSEGFKYIETFFLVFFVGELTLRLLRDGPVFFRHPDDYAWNWLDLFIVVSGVIDQWVMPLIASFSEKSGGKKSRQYGVMVLLMRLLRLFRVVRLFRLVKIIRPLYTLAQGILEALQGMFWVLVTMALLFYAMGILCTRLLGHRLILPRQASSAVEEEVDKIASLFRTVPYSMYILFETMSGWTLARFEPLFTALPPLRLCFTLFYIYSTWTLLAVMTGVVSENMIAMREAAQREDEEKDEVRRMRATDVLVELFNRADVDGSGTVSREEFEDLLSSADDLARLKKHTKCRLSDLIDLFDTLDENGDDDITIEEFISGFRAMNEPLSSKFLMKIERRMREEIHAMNNAGEMAGEKMPVPEPQDLLQEVSAVSAQLDKVLARLDDIHDGQRRHAAVLERLTEEARVTASARQAAQAAIDLSAREDALSAAVAAESETSKSTKAWVKDKLFRRGSGPSRAS